MNKLATSRNILFVLLCTFSFVFYWVALRNLVILGFRTDEYSHTIVIPILTLGLVALERSKIFAKARYSPRIGTALLVVGVLIGAVFGADVPVAGENNAFALKILSLVLVWVGSFILCYGWDAFRAGMFPLIFLLLTVPIPDFLLGKVILSVQHGSAEVVSLGFGLARVPVFRDGFSFLLPGASIHVARECSGIHSTMALLIVSLLAGHLFLRSNLKRLVLVLCAIPIVCITNGIRITALTLLAIHVNGSFLRGSLHREGGFMFFALGLVIMFCVLRLMGFHLKRRPDPARTP